MKTARLLYPEKRTITERDVLAWANDLWADSIPRRRCCACGTVTVAAYHDKPVAEVRAGEFAANDPNNPCDCAADYELCNEENPPIGFEECMDFLEDIGAATFARR